MSNQPTPQEIAATQGTRNSDLAPWMSYAAEMNEKLDPTLEAGVAEYSQNRHTTSSSQNEEELCRQLELNEEIGKQYQWVHPSEYADEGPRIGSIMHSSTLITKLRKHANEYYWFYRDHPQPRKVTLLYAPKNNRAGDLQVACWAQLGYMPEYSIMRFDHHGVPLDERMRGWRTCLLQIAMKKLITEDTINKVFGRAQGPACTRYNQIMYGLRNTIKD